MWRDPLDHSAEWVPASTHELHLTDHTVTKTFRSWARGEHVREWRALRLLDKHAPGLAPRPLGSQLETEPPTVTMTRLSGEPFGAQSATATEVAALATAVDTLHRAVPPTALAQIPLRIWHPAEAVQEVRRWSAEPLPTDLEPLVEQAHTAAAQWLRGGDLDHAVAADIRPVFGHADGNVANHLYDGSAVRLVDFEDSGRSDVALELADLLEHLSTRLRSALEPAAVLAHFDLSRAETGRVRTYRRLLATFWLLMLMPGAPAHLRNPPGSGEHQARRVLELLG